MARSSQTEPVEKFRFKVTFFTLGFDTEINRDKVLPSGFSDVTVPKANVNVMEYRENTDMNRSIKIPGLISYDPITLKKGVTTNKSLYNWYKQVHNDVSNLTYANEVLASVNVVRVHDPDFRKEMLISSLDREGNAVKHWLCFNCFPISYQGGDVLSASDNGKLISEMSITYEAMVEVTGDTVLDALQDLADESTEATRDAVKNALKGAVAGAASPFLRSQLS